jgi:uncharacterized membrane protein YeaQ/YmgE (transglycosylase-associated protein family)
MEQIISFIILGALGGLLHVLIHTSSLKEALQYNSSKWIIIGAISGLAYYFLYSDYHFPNSFMAIVVGYTGADFIIAAAARVRRLLGVEQHNTR